VEGIYASSRTPLKTAPDESCSRPLRTSLRPPNEMQISCRPIISTPAQTFVPYSLTGAAARTERCSVRACRLHLRVRPQARPIS